MTKRAHGSQGADARAADAVAYRPDGDARNWKVMVRVAWDEYEAIDDAAKRAGMSAATWVRMVAMRAAK